MATRKSGPWYEDENYNYYDDEEKAWFAKYYPVQARLVSKKDALDHSLRKWIGLRKKNLEKLGLKEPPIDVSDITCALCKHYADLSPACKGCPLIKAGDGRRCDESKSEDEDAPFFHYHDSGDPEPMIRLIRKAIKARDAKKAR